MQVWQNRKLSIKMAVSLEAKKWGFESLTISFSLNFMKPPRNIPSRVDKYFRVQYFQEWLLFSWEKIGSLIFKLHETSRRDSLQESKDFVHL